MLDYQAKRARWENAIDEGGSVLHRGLIITDKRDLPTEESFGLTWDQEWSDIKNLRAKLEAKQQHDQEQEWGALIKEERDVIWQREFLAWMAWYNSTAANRSVEDLKTLLGPIAGTRSARFTSEGLIAKDWTEEVCLAWSTHLADAKKKIRLYEDKVRRYWRKLEKERIQAEKAMSSWDRELARGNVSHYELRFTTNPRVRCRVRIHRGYLDESNIHVQRRELKL